METEAHRVLAAMEHFETKYDARTPRAPLDDPHPSRDHWDGRTVTCGTRIEDDGRQHRVIDFDSGLRIRDGVIGGDEIFDYVWSRAGC